MGFITRKPKKKELKKPDFVRDEDEDEDEEIVSVGQSRRSEPSIVKKKYKYLVVKELPTQQIRRTKAEDGTIVYFVTVEEALTEFMNKEEE